jgi:hypothetical protein
VSSERLHHVAYVGMYSQYHIWHNSPFTVTSARTLNFKQWIKTYFRAYRGISWTHTCIYIINKCLMITTLCQLRSVHEVSTLRCDVNAHIHETDLLYRKSLYLHMAEFSVDFIWQWTQNFNLAYDREVWTQTLHWKTTTASHLLCGLLCCTHMSTLRHMTYNLSQIMWAICWSLRMFHVIHKFCDTVRETRMDLLMMYMTKKCTPHPFCLTWMLGFNFFVLLTVHPCIIL